MTYFQKAMRMAELAGQAARLRVQWIDLRNLSKPVAPCLKRPYVQTVTVDTAYVKQSADAIIADILTEACKGTQFSVVKV